MIEYIFDISLNNTDHIRNIQCVDLGISVGPLRGSSKVKHSFVSIYLIYLTEKDMYEILAELEPYNKGGYALNQMLYYILGDDKYIRAMTSDTRKELKNKIRGILERNHESHVYNIKKIITILNNINIGNKTSLKKQLASFMYLPTKEPLSKDLLLDKHGNKSMLDNVTSDYMNEGTQTFIISEDNMVSKIKSNNLDSYCKNDFEYMFSEIFLEKMDDEKNKKFIRYYNDRNYSDELSLDSKSKYPWFKDSKNIEYNTGWFLYCANPISHSGYFNRQCFKICRIDNDLIKITIQPPRSIVLPDKLLNSLKKNFDIDEFDNFLLKDVNSDYLGILPTITVDSSVESIYVNFHNRIIGGYSCTAFANYYDNDSINSHEIDLKYYKNSMSLIESVLLLKKDYFNDMINQYATDDEFDLLLRMKIVYCLILTYCKFRRIHPMTPFGYITNNYQQRNDDTFNLYKLTETSLRNIKAHSLLELIDDAEELSHV